MNTSMSRSGNSDNMSCCATWRMLHGQPRTPNSCRTSDLISLQNNSRIVSAWFYCCIHRGAFSYPWTWHHFGSVCVVLPRVGRLLGASVVGWVCSGDDGVGTNSLYPRCHMVCCSKRTMTVVTLMVATALDCSGVALVTASV